MDDSGGSDAAGWANINAQGGIIVTIAFRAGRGINFVKNLAGADGFGWANRFAVAASGAHIGVDFHCHEVSPFTLSGALIRGHQQ